MNTFMRNARFTPVAVCLVLCVTAVQAADYPLTLAATAQVSQGSTTVTSKLTIQVERLMNQTYRQRVTDALKFGGYPSFLKQLRALPGHRHHRSRWAQGGTALRARGTSGWREPARPGRRCPSVLPRRSGKS